jgi:hypothetical protein
LKIGLVSQNWIIRGDAEVEKNSYKRASEDWKENVSSKMPMSLLYKMPIKNAHQNAHQKCPSKMPIKNAHQNAHQKCPSKMPLVKQGKLIMVLPLSDRPGCSLLTNIASAITKWGGLTMSADGNTRILCRPACINACSPLHTYDVCKYLHTYKVKGTLKNSYCLNISITTKTMSMT